MNKKIANFIYIIISISMLSVIYILLKSGKKELLLIESIGEKIVASDNYSEDYWNYITLSEEELKMINKRRLNLKYQNYYFYFLLSSGFDDVYYYNITKKCWQNHLIGTILQKKCNKDDEIVF